MAEYQGKYKSVYNPGIEFETDYIAREAARDLMYHNQGPLTEYDLNDLPPADVKPVVRGQWVDDEFGYLDEDATVHPIWSCSCCGTVFEEFEKKPVWSYCPNCGADMRGESDG